MSHVAEGELHAWLDGALDHLGEERARQVREHLRRCSACQQALAAEEALRTRAADVLALAMPNVGEAPPLEALMERARGPRDEPVRRRRMPRVSRLGWAASVLVALGAGWTARELGLRPSARGGTEVASDPGAASTEAEAAPVAEASDRLQSAGGDLGAARGQSDFAPVQGAAESSAAARREPSSDAVRTGPVAVAAPNVGGTPRPAEARAPAAAELADPARANRRVMAPPAVVRPEPLTQPLRLPAVAPAATARSADDAPRSEAVGLARVSAAVAGAGLPGIGMQRARGDSARAGVPDLFHGLAEVGVNGAALGMTVEADVEEGVGLTVPGLDVLRVEWTDVVPGRRGLRVLQRLAAGDTLDIRFVRSGGAAADAVNDPLATVVGAVLPDGWSQVVCVHGDGWLVTRARMERTALKALVATAGRSRR